MLVGSAAAFFAAVLHLAETSYSAEPVRFNRDVRPILSENCFFCHGFDSNDRRADLRLDVREAAIADRGGYSAVVPGKPDESELVLRIASADEDIVMPPQDSPYKLTATQIETLRKWIEQGAEYQQHWAYAPLVRPEVPAIDAADSGHPIDAFIAAQLQLHGLESQGVADARTLARRLAFDLTGLPPTLAQVRSLERDSSEAAVHSLIDELMESRAYAEHMATWWLDLVRWADTSGMVSDEPIDTQAYRSYVVNAFDANKPFDRFTIEQLAGDLLSNPTDETLVASGYNRLVRTNCEAGVIPLEALYAMKVDHVSALGTVWLGSTTACCQCHDHKFDPITQRDFYRLAAFFDDLQETGVYSPGDRRAPVHYVFADAKAKHRAKILEETIAKTSAVLYRDDETLDDGQADWEQSQRKALGGKDTETYVWLPAKLPAAYIHSGDLFTLAEIDGQRAREQVSKPDKVQRHLLAEPLTGFLEDGVVKQGTFFVDVYIDPQNPPQSVAVQLIQGGYGRMGWRPDIYQTFAWGPEESFRDAAWIHQPRYRHMGQLPKAQGWVRLEVPGKQMFPLVDGAYRHMGVAWAHTGGHVGWGDTGFLVKGGKAAELKLGETAFRMFDNVPIHRDMYEKKMSLVAKAIKQKPNKRTQQQKTLVKRAYRENTLYKLQDELHTAEGELFRLRAQHSHPALVSKSLKPKVTHVVERGDFRSPIGSPVVPAIPEFLGELPATADPSSPRATRLDLARWLVSRDNPLTARVFVNRMWAQFYGEGMSSTLEDVGGQGRWPTHPELLDWLAVDFIESGWDVKRLVRKLVTAKTYRLQSKPNEALLAADPENHWLARQRSRRLSAEQIRDNSLAVSGLLVSNYDALASIYPYQPATYWDGTNKVMLGSRFLDYHASNANRQHVRTLYTFWKRIGTHPTLLTFDAPSRQACSAARSATNTPGQALVLLNDPIFVEAARSLAEELVFATDDSLTLDEATRRRIHVGFERCLQRQPTQAEAGFLTQYLRAHLDYYSQHTDEATELISIGVKEPNPDIALPEYAAWTSLCRVLLNLHETITRN